MTTIRARIDHLIGCSWFWVWALVGAGAALGLVSLGLLALVPATAIGAVLARNARIRSCAFGLLTGAGALFLFVAYLQREGPGTTCWQTATAAGCDEHLDPRPWLVVGLALVAAGVVGHVIRSGTRRRDGA